MSSSGTLPLPNKRLVERRTLVMNSTEARQRVLEVAEQLFAQKGYNAVTVRDIAVGVGIHHTTLYHHVPGGKEQLFVEVVERTFQRHRVGLTRALAQGSPDLRAQLRAAADWLLSQPPMDQVRLVYSDMPSIDPVQAERLSNIAYESMLLPIETALRFAQQQATIHHHDLPLVAGLFLGMIESLHAVPQQTVTKNRQMMAYEGIDVFLFGLSPRNESGTSP
jgi:AcrR family transcriptional regulator